MRRRSGIAGVALWGVVAVGGCGGAPQRGTVSDVKVVGLADLTGRAPGDVRSGLATRIPALAVEMGLIGGAGQDPGHPILLRGDIVEFPTRGRSSAAAGGWINGGAIGVTWTVMEENGTVLGTKTITTDPRDAIDAPEDPFVDTQARGVLLWLLGK